MHLASVDLNLLVALDALLRERHVTRAATAVGLSQSAMSHALRRLRTLFDDPLLVRGAAGMVSTPRADALERPVRALLASAEALLGSAPRFDPSSATRLYRLACEDLATSLLAPSLLARFSDEAPGCDLDMAAYPREVMLSGLEKGELDLAITVLRKLPAAFRRQVLLEEGFACVVREDHPRIKKRLTLKQYVEVPHALIGPGDRGDGVVDTALRKLGHRRRVRLRVSQFIAAPLIVAESDLVLTMPRRLAERLAGMAKLRVHEAPLELPTFKLAAIWHERRQRDPAHMFLRQSVSAVARELS